MEIVLSSHRALVFRDADIPALKRSQVELVLFAGNEDEVCQELLP